MSNPAMCPFGLTSVQDESAWPSFLKENDQLLIVDGVLLLFLYTSLVCAFVVYENKSSVNTIIKIIYSIFVYVLTIWIVQTNAALVWIVSIVWIVLALSFGCAYALVSKKSRSRKSRTENKILKCFENPFQIISLYLRVMHSWNSFGVILTGLAIVVCIALALLSLLLQLNFMLFLIPVVVSFACGLILFLIYYHWQEPDKQDTNMEALLMKLAAFDHNSKGANLFASLQFNLENIMPEMEMTESFSEYFHSLVSQFNAVVGDELKTISEYQFIVKYQVKSAYEQLCLLRRLQRTFSELCGAIERNIQPGTAHILQAKTDLKSLRDNLDNLRRKIRLHTRIDVIRTIQDVIKQFQDRPVHIDLIAPAAVPLVCISSRALNEILSELIMNAIRSMRQKSSRTITIRVKISQMIELDIEDNGAGIAEENFKTIFDEGFTTRPGGGQGLYFVKKTLQKYDAQIFVRESKPDHGTIMTIGLQKFVQP